MGLFDDIKSRLGMGSQSDYVEGDEYYDGEEYYDGADEVPEDNRYYDDAADNPDVASQRNTSVFNDYTPLVSMSDVRSQELPRLASQSASIRSSTRTARGASPASAQGNPQIKTSLPYIDESNFSTQDTGSLQPVDNETLDSQFSILDSDDTRPYNSEDSADPLLQRHSLSNTGDFATTAPAYYASRSGIGHVRPAGQGRRTHKFREAVVIRPENYAEAEQVAVNLRRGNAVVLLLAQTRPELAKRILDFSFGAAAAMEGQVVSIGERIYALTSDHALTDNEIELLRARGIL